MLTKVEQSPYMLALQSSRIVEMKKGDAMKDFNAIIGKVLFDVGQPKNPDDVFQLCESLHGEVKTYFNFLRIDEVRIAFQNGVRGHYGEFFGINTKTFHQWLRGYQVSEIRREKLKELKKEEKKDFHSPEAKLQGQIDWWNMIIREHEGFLNGKGFSTPADFYKWNLLETNGLVKISKEEKVRIYEEAKKDFATRTAEGVTNFNLRRKIKSMREAIEQDKISGDQKNEIRALACHIATKRFYEGIKHEDFKKAVEQIIKNIKGS